VLGGLERVAGIQLSNRFVWFVVAVTLLNIAMASVSQIQFQRFETLDLMAINGMFLELGLTLCMLILLLATPMTRRRWEERLPGLPFSYILNGIAAVLNCCLLLLLMLAPVLLVHRYPALEEAGIRIWLMLGQRQLLVLFAVLISANLLQIARYPLRLPWQAAGLIGAASQIGIGYYVAYLSYYNETFLRLNDVFYYNQLSKRFDWFPELTTQHVFHNIEAPWFGQYAGAAALAWLFTLLLWLPAAAALSRRQHRQTGP